MRAFLLLARFRVAAILLVGIASSQPVIASEVPTKSGHVRYTTGTAEVRSDRMPQRLDVTSDPARSQRTGQWQVASVDASVLAGQASTVVIKQASFELTSAANFESGVVAQDPGPVMRSAEATRSKEPAFWAPALSTLALALFFFLRRLA